MLTVTKVRHSWPEKKGFMLSRRNNNGDYIFLHFHQQVRFTLNGKTVDTKPNAVVIINKNTSNVIDCAKCDLTHDFIHIQGNVEGVLSLYGLKTDIIYYPCNCGFITDIVRNIEGENFENEKFNDTLIDNYLNILFALLARNIGKKPEGFVVDYKTETAFKNLRIMVFSHLERDWPISSMAEIVNLSESRFYVIYKAVFKTTPNQDLIVARMDYAKQLLSQNKNIAIFDVAQECGYANEFHFIRIFKKNVGVTPKKYAMMQWANPEKDKPNRK